MTQLETSLSDGFVTKLFSSLNRDAMKLLCSTPQQSKEVWDLLTQLGKNVFQ